MEIHRKLVYTGLNSTVSLVANKGHLESVIWQRLFGLEKIIDIR
jgi:hypothetical protein